PGATAAALPAQPRGPTLAPRARPPEGPEWLHEMLIDGRRLLARATLGEEVALFDDDGEPLDGEESACFAAVANAVGQLPAQDLVVDGVVTALFPDGRPRANGLPAALEGEGDGVLTYYLTDLLFLDGHDLSATPLARRKALLTALLARVSPPGPLRLSDHIPGNGEAFFRQACQVGLPGIVSRRADAAVGAPNAAFVVACVSGSA
ncbi:MAG: ligD, partial [Myxococcales bacterium]|nr:ligD [Myxococcales bacterium]